MYIDDLLGETEIARRLNQEGVPSEFDRPWSPWMVKSVLTNEKYLGDMVFNRGSFKLHRNSVHNPRDEWIRNTGAFESPLPVGLFARGAGRTCTAERET
ncbi:recombinase family protein [Massilia sp. H-1]|nr:recombinase family protein [Massilia sp. H-1]